MAQLSHTATGKKTSFKLFNSQAEIYLSILLVLPCCALFCHTDTACLASGLVELLSLTLMSEKVWILGITLTCGSEST